MSITIKGIKLRDITVTRDEEGKIKVTGNYSVLSSTDKVIAKQGFNGYNDIEVSWTAETQRLIESAVAAIKQDVELTLGLGE